MRSFYELLCVTEELVSTFQSIFFSCAMTLLLAVCVCFFSLSFFSRQFFSYHFAVSFFSSQDIFYLAIATDKTFPKLSWHIEQVQN